MVARLPMNMVASLTMPNGWDPNLTVVIATILLLVVTWWLSKEKENG